MTNFDPSQQRVLELDPTRHGRVVGAPGTGKTTLVIESFARVASLSGWADDELLILAANRLVAKDLRARLEHRLHRAIGDTPVRTVPAFAFWLVSRAAATAGETPPRLLTGATHDELIAESVTEHEPGATLGALFSPETVNSDVFRSELREFSRVLDDFGMHPAHLQQTLPQVSREAAGQAYSTAPSAELSAHWSAAAHLLESVEARRKVERADEHSASSILREATTLVRSDTRGPLPRLIIVDDAQELGEGELALLSACVSRGSRVWVFGDPDIATGNFQGERTRVLSGLTRELRRKTREQEQTANVQAVANHAPAFAETGEQAVVLDIAHRHGAELRGFVRALTQRVGTSGVGEQRGAVAGSEDGEARACAAIRFVTAPTLSEQLGAIAHRLRQRKLGLEAPEPVPWRRMAVICRSRGEATRASRVLSGLQVPTVVGSGGIVLRESEIVRELVRLLQHSLGIRPLDAADTTELLTGSVGSLDPISVRRLRAALRLAETREARAEERAARTIDDVILSLIEAPEPHEVLDSSEGRALRQLQEMLHAGQDTRRQGGTAREVLWALWKGTGLAKKWQTVALEARGARSDDAHRSLDAVVGLFYELQRHEEQAREQPIAELLAHILTSTLPSDTLAAQSQRDVVTVTTPQGVIGKEFDIVCILGPQDGDWPNLRTRGSLLGVTALERWLRGGSALGSSRQETLHDELRLFAHACARATDEVLAIAVKDEDHHPSAFFGLGEATHMSGPLPTTRVTLRGAVAAMRRRLTENPGDAQALDSLAVLARESVDGADPLEWYGTRAPSTEAPLVDLEDEQELNVRVSPSQLENAERCPLDWAISRLGGGTSNVASHLGILLHSAFEGAMNGTAEEIMGVVEAEWHTLQFDAAWEAERAHVDVTQMSESLAEYLQEFQQSERYLLGEEVAFAVDVDRALLVGKADRLEGRRLDDETLEITVIDLKTGRTKPTQAEREQHAQMQSYQLGVIRNAFEIDEGQEMGKIVSGGARLLYVHPDAVGKKRIKEGQHFEEVTQPPLDSAAQKAFLERVQAVVPVMAAGTFTARVEHHCSQQFSKGGACRIHIVQSVSHA